MVLPKTFLKPPENQYFCCWSPLGPILSLLGPHWSPLSPHLVQFGSYLGPLCPIWFALGPTLVPFDPHLVSVSSHLVPIWPHLVIFSDVLGSRQACKTSEESTLSDFGTHLGLWPSWCRLGSVLEVSWAIFGTSLDVLGASWRVLERLARCLRVVLGWTWNVLRPFLGILWRLGESWDVLAASWGRLGASWRRLEASWASWGSVFARLGCVLGRLEPFSACPGTVSETSWH